MLGGVAGGISQKLGIDPTVVRLGFVLASLASGFGAALYVIAWLLLPEQGGHNSIAAKAINDWRGIAMALSFVPVLVLALVVGSALGAGWIGTIATPLSIGAGGLVLVWRNVGDDERALMGRLLRPFARLGLTGKGSWRLLLARAAIGAALVAGGLTALILGSNRAVLRPLGGVFLVVAGAVVVFGPWWLHIVRDLVDERQARALAEERADMAARIHDSVLQTLALIQHHADQPQQIVKLARAQERELRSWLFEGQVPGATDDEVTTLAAAIQRIQRDVEELHEIPVEAVVVGDCPLDEGLRSLLEAGREATVNAAKWSGAPVVSIFVEVEPDEVAMFVRDRGIGFDIGEVASDRRGLAESIHGRMARHGGTAEVRSTPGVGTEVHLNMPRDESKRARVGRS
jgi:signal transduction histidine kinase/phage shock protein PspC (stress-responsive transcriptional regulator)